MNSSDLSGKIVFKVKLDKEIKKIVIHNDDINYNELLLMMQRIFSERIKPNDEFTIKYTDEENDLITLSNDSDVLLALQNSKILKLTIFLKEDEEHREDINHADISKELHNIRLSIDRFLEKFEKSLKLNNYKNFETSQLTNEIKSVNLNNGSSNSIKKDFHIEFDPLNKSNDQALKLPKNSRAETPDSIGSNELINNGKKQNGTEVQQNTYSNIGSQVKDDQSSQHSSQYTQDQVHQQNYPSSNQYGNLHNQQQAQQLTQQPPTNTLPQQQQQQYPNLKAPIAQHPQQQNNFGYPQTGLPLSNVPVDPKHQQQMIYQQQQQQPQQYPGSNQYGYLAGTQQQQQGQQPQQYPGSNQYGYLAGTQQQQQGQGMTNSPGGSYQANVPNQSSLNPYSKPPTTSIARPPSATIYQQGYK